MCGTPVAQIVKPAVAYGPHELEIGVAQHAKSERVVYAVEAGSVDTSIFRRFYGQTHIDKRGLQSEPAVAMARPNMDVYV